MMSRLSIKKIISPKNVIFIIFLIGALIYFFSFFGTYSEELSANAQTSVSEDDLPRIQSDSSHLPLSLPNESQTSRNIRKVKGIVEQYHETHPYNVSDMFVAGDMATDVWNLVETQGIHAVINVGNVDTDISDIQQANHVWVLAETSPNQWVALETTGGFVVCDDPAFCPIHNPRYYHGWGYKTPKELNDALATLKHPCSDGYILGDDVKCHLACGANTYCTGDSVCVNDKCKVAIPFLF